MAIIGKADQQDLPALRKLAISIFTATYETHNNREDFKAYMYEAFSDGKIESEFLETGTQFFVAMEADELVGYARVRESTEVNHLLGESNMELQRLYVDKPWQGKGIADQLIAACEDYARASKDWIWLDVWERNPKAINFYRKHGYEKFSEHTFLLGQDAQVDWLMRKRIGGAGSLRFNVERLQKIHRHNQCC